MSAARDDLVLSASSNMSVRAGIESTPEQLNGLAHIESSLITGNRQTVEELLQEREWLCCRRSQLKAELQASQTGPRNYIDDVPDEELPQLYDGLKNKLLMKAVVHNGRELFKEQVIGRREMLADILCDEDGETDQEMLEMKRELESLLDEYTAVAVQVAKEYQEVEALEKTLKDIKAENLELSKKSQALYSQIEKKKQEREEELKILTTDSSGTSVHDKLKTKLHQNFIQNNTLQALILGSGLDWTQDPKLRQMMISAGRTVNI